MNDAHGFTLVELLMVIAIIGILWSILFPVYGNAINKARDAQTICDLALLRMTLSMFYADQLTYPSFAAPWNQPAGYGYILRDALVPLYIDAIPKALLSGGHHTPSDKVFDVWNMQGLHEDPLTGSGEGWRYDANPFDIAPSSEAVSFGSISVLCYHTNASNRNWQSY